MDKMLSNEERGEIARLKTIREQAWSDAEQYLHSLMLEYGVGENGKVRPAHINPTSPEVQYLVAQSLKRLDIGNDVEGGIYMQAFEEGLTQPYPRDEKDIN